MRIDDLRTTLHDHAELTHDEGLVDRAGAVRGRVRAVRRRRAAVAVACVAGAVLAVPAIQALEVTPPDAAGSRDLAGRTAPESFVSNGYTYDFDYGVEGPASEELRLRLPRADEPRLVSWTVSAGGVDGALRDRLSGDRYRDTWVGGGEDFETFEHVPEGAVADLRLTPADGPEDGEMAMAVYTLSDEPPAGVTAHGVTFREEAAGETLLAGAIGEPGGSTVSFDVTVPARELSLSPVCKAPKDHWIFVTVEGQRGASGTSCSPDIERDPAGGGFGIDLTGNPRGEVGDTVTVTATLHADDRSGSEPVSEPGAFIGLAAYAQPESRTIAGTDQEVRSLIERDGHTWALADLVTSEPGEESLDRRVGPVDATTYLEFGAVNDGSNLRWSTRIDGAPLGRSSSGPAGGYGPGETVVLSEGESMRVEQAVVEGADESLRFYVAEYTLAD